MESEVAAAIAKAGQIMIPLSLGVSFVGFAVVSVLGSMGLTVAMGSLRAGLIERAVQRIRFHPVRSFLIGLGNWTLLLIASGLGDKGIPLGNLISLVALVLLMSLAAMAIAAYGAVIDGGLRDRTAAASRVPGAMGGAAFGAAVAFPIVGQVFGLLCLVTGAGAIVEAWWSARSKDVSPAAPVQRGPDQQAEQDDRRGS